MSAEYFGKVQKSGISIGDISIDCVDPLRTRDFYAKFTGWKKREAYGCPALVGDNGLLMLFMGCDFEFTPPVWPEEPGKQQKQMHFNFQVDDLSTAVEEAIKLGATKAVEQFGGDHFVTILDTEGHPFCLCRR
ncbi:MAG: VOC family protein [Saccharofermentanales bacterium]